MKTDGMKEFGAMVGVVLSLLFVGFEIRQNTNAVRGATLHGIADQSFQYNLELAQDPEFMRLMATVFIDSTGIAALPPEDRMRLTFGLAASTRIMENRYRQFQLGILDEDELESLGGAGNRAWYASRMFQEWWVSQEPETRWSPDFVAYMEREVVRLRP